MASVAPSSHRFDDEPPPLDERPVAAQTVLALAAALVTLLVLLLGQCNHEWLAQRGWWQLTGVAVTWILLAGGSSIRSDRVGQRLRFAAAVSLVLHAALAIGLLLTDLSFLVPPAAPPEGEIGIAGTAEGPLLVEVIPPTPKEKPLFERPVVTEQLAVDTTPLEQQRLNTPVAPLEMPALEQELSSLPPLATTERPQPDISSLSAPLPRVEQRERPRESAQAWAAPPEPQQSHETFPDSPPFTETPPQLAMTPLERLLTEEPSPWQPIEAPTIEPLTGSPRVPPPLSEPPQRSPAVPLAPSLAIAKNTPRPTRPSTAATAPPFALQLRPLPTPLPQQEVATTAASSLQGLPLQGLPKADNNHSLPRQQLSETFPERFSETTRRHLAATTSQKQLAMVPPPIAVPRESPPRSPLGPLATGTPSPRSPTRSPSTLRSRSQSASPAPALAVASLAPQAITPPGSNRGRTNLANARSASTPPNAIPQLASRSAGPVRRPAPAFAPRAQRLATPAPSDGPPRTEAAIELGLTFLAPLQQSDGRWSFDHFGDLKVSPEEMPTIQADAAATGLVLLAFLGAGYDQIDGKYHDVILRGLQFLLAQQGTAGDIFPERNSPTPNVTRFYSHGIAALALCEAYGMTGDPQLAYPAQRALDYIRNTQHSQLHGWRYSEQVNADLSVSAWQIMALRSGELAGLEVDQQTYDRTRLFLTRCRGAGEQQAFFRYNPYTPVREVDKQHHYTPGTVMTSVGLLMELYLGENRNSPILQQGTRHLLANLPQHSPTGPRSLHGEVARIGTLGNPLRDTYYWYYATQVLFHMGGDAWQQWHEHLHPLLLQHQTQQGELAGSWSPSYPIPDRWGPQAGRIYVTSMNLLSLEVRHRHLPLYEMTGN